MSHFRPHFWQRLAAFALTGILLSIVQLKVERPMILLERFIPGGGWLEIALLSFYAAWITGRMMEPRQSPVWRRRIWAWFSAVFFAQLLIGLAGFTQFLMSGSLHLPIPALIAAGPAYRGEGFFMLGLFAATILIVGPGWCSHLCYIGAWDNLAANQGRRPMALPKWREKARLGVLVGVLGVAVTLRVTGTSPLIAAWLAGGFALLGVGLMVFWSRKKASMVHCTAFCPIGVLATRFGRVSPFRIKIAPSCTDCGACTLACRYDALGKEQIRLRVPASSCTLCGDCVGRCRGGSINYAFPGMRAESARKFYIVLAVSLHAVFLGVARI